MKPEQKIMEILKRRLPETDDVLLTEIAVSISGLYKKRKKPITIPFEDSLIFDKNNFKAAFPSWSVEKLAYYYYSADAYSAEGNEYADWGKAIANWERRDKAKGLKFEDEKLVYKPKG